MEKTTTTSSVDKTMSRGAGEVYSIDGEDQMSAIGDGMTKAEEKKLLRKIDRWLLPLLMLSYMLQFLDKQTLNFASVMGLVDDLHFHGSQYAWSGSIFYFGYLAFSYPGSYLMVRLPLGKYLACTCIVWATCLCCHAATTSWTGFMVVRFFLGASEASISPGFGLLTGMFYKRAEQPFRCGIWFFGNSLAVMCGSLLAYAIGHINSSLAPWRWLFIIFGIVTLLWAVVLLWFLPDSPSTARFLSLDERTKAVDRVRENQTGLKSNTWKWEQAFEAMTDIRVWLVVLYQFANAIPNGAITSFNSLVIKGLGFSRFEVYLLQIPTGVVHGFFALFSTWLCSHYRDTRCIIAACLSIVSLIGSVLVQYGPNVGSNLFGLFIFVAYAAGIPISLSMISSNVAGFTKKAVASAMMFIAYCAGNIIGPFLFFPSEAERHYPVSIAAPIIPWLC